MQFSDFQPAYEEEENKKSLDVLNIWYVAFTRATDMLYILTDVSKEAKESDKWEIKQALESFIHDGERMDEDLYEMTELGEGIHYYGDYGCTKVGDTEPAAAPTFRSSSPIWTSAGTNPSRWCGRKRPPRRRRRARTSMTFYKN